MAQQAEDTEFRLRVEIKSLKEQAGGLRMALIRVLEEGLTPETRNVAYKALQGDSHA